MTEPTFDVILPDEHRPGDDYDPSAAQQRLRACQPPASLRNPQVAARHYVMDPNLAVAANMAIAVGAPLLVTGEPGTGKTQVAWFLGRYFGTEVFAYQVRSTSTAEDIKYDFDAVAYLRTAQIISNGDQSQREDFLHRRALWQAYEYCNEHGIPAVVLIDEIDKAPRDFPNDLLLELDQHRFRHPLNPQHEICAEPPPLVVVTSNAERRLPDAFLRRCIVHHIELDKDLLLRAVAAHYGHLADLPQGLVAKAVERLLEIREYSRLSRRPATAELLAWLAILRAQGKSVNDIGGALVDMAAVEALIKNHEDLELLRRG